MIENFAADQSSVPWANDDSVTVDQDSAVEINVLSNDVANQVPRSQFYLHQGGD